MTILAIEFSSDQRSVAVFDGGRVCGAASEIGGRSVKALGLVESALRAVKLEREQIECIAVGLGPGSYTGIRAAIALAQGWELALPVKLLGVSSADCLAAQAQAAGWFGRVNIVMDAQRQEFYLASYDVAATGCSLAEPFHLLTDDEEKVRRQRGEIFVGPDVKEAGDRIVLPEAATLARVAAGRSDFVAGEKLEPVYLRVATFVKAPPPRIVT